MRSIRRIAIGLLVVVLIGAGLAYLNRTPLQVWHAVRGLRLATQADRGEWIDHIVTLGEPAIEPLFEALTEDNDAADNCLAAIDHLARVNGAGHPATGELARRLADRFANLPPRYQVVVLQFVRDWMKGTTAVDPLPEAACRLVSGSCQADSTVQIAGLDLAGVLIEQPGNEIGLTATREATQAGLASPTVAVRLSAVRICLAPGLGLRGAVAGLLRDPCPEVRRTAILVVGTDEQAIGEDGLLPCLHDGDAEVRRLAEVALKSRGLNAAQIEVGRLLTHPHPGERLHVLDYIRRAISNQGANEIILDPGQWLRRLSHDPSPAVRAATLRLMCQQKLVDLNDRVDQMVRDDTSPTVALLARFYLENPH